MSVIEQTPTGGARIQTWLGDALDLVPADAERLRFEVFDGALADRNDPRTSTFVALARLIGHAALDADWHMLAVAVEAYERGGWDASHAYEYVQTAGWNGHREPADWSADECRRIVQDARRGRHKTKLRHEAELLLALLRSQHVAVARPKDWSL